MARLANSLVRLRDQVNAAYPGRSTASDGWIGNAAHAASASDHNPNSQGVVCALDLTNDPANGFDVHALAERLRVNRHPNLRYIISNRRIASAGTNWNWQPYYGSNAHDKHAHFSVGNPTTTTEDGRSTSNYDDARDWAIYGSTPSVPRKSNDVIASEVIAGAWGNNPDRANRLRNAGYDPVAIQAIVNQKLGGGLKPAPAPRPSNNQVADQVIAGAWGSGQNRKDRLAAAGYDYNAVQAIVNQKLGYGAAVPGRKSNEQVANEILAGKWGNGKERASRVSAAGYDYRAIQNIVNKKLGY